MKRREIDPRALAEAKVVRLWRTAIDPSRAEEYDDFARTKSLPMFRAQPGFKAVVFSSHNAQRMVITLWKDWESVDALRASTTYQATVKELETSGFLSGEQVVEAFAIDGIG